MRQAPLSPVLRGEGPGVRGRPGQESPLTPTPLPGVPGRGALRSAAESRARAGSYHKPGEGRLGADRGDNQEAAMQLGMIGLGRMGSNMVRRLLRGGHQCVAYDVHPDAVSAIVKEGARGANSLQEFVKALDRPRVAWLMVPAAVVDSTLHSLVPMLEDGDIVIDGGNSYYIDDIRRARELKPKGLHYVDVGTSGGVWGLERGYCMMIGGENEVVKRLDPIFATLAPGRGDIDRTPGRDKAPAGTAENGYLHCGPNGAGHFVKMVHNGIEYGIMAAYAEGMGVLKAANVGKQ